MSTHRPAGRQRVHATIIIALFILAVAAAAFTGWRYARESPPHQGPIVLIAVDTMRADAVAPGPRDGSTTPALDALTADSVWFSHAYSHSTQQVPAFVSIATGELPLVHGVRDDGGLVLREGVRTVAEQLRSRGFSTGGVASTFLLRRSTGIARGLGFYDAEAAPATDVPQSSLPATRDGVATYEAAQTWMRQQGGQRFFLTLQITRDSAEAVVARLVAELKERRRYDDATIILTAMRGDAGSGATIDEASIHVPLLIKLPAQEGAGRTADLPVQHIDLLPTLLDFVRAPIPGGLRGRSLRPVLDDEDTLAPTPIYSESLEAAMRVGGFPVYALTSGSARLVRSTGDRVLAVDGQTVPADATALGAALDALLKDRALPLPTPVAPSEVTRFAAAGYVDGLRAWVAPMPALEEADQVSLVEAHRAAVRRAAAGDWPAEIAALRAMVRTHPTLAAVQFQLGQRLMATGRVGEALAVLKAADMLRPDDPQIATALTLASLRAGQIGDAAMLAEQAVMRADAADVPAKVGARLAALQVALAAMDATAAATHAAEVEKIDPTLPLGDYVEGRIALQEKRFEDAAAALQNAARALQAKPASVPDLQLALGEALSELGKDDEAEAAFKQERQIFPLSVAAYAGLATFYQTRSQTDAMAETLDELIADIPTADAYTTAARVWASAGNRTRADMLRAEARRRFRGDPALAGLR